MKVKLIQVTQNPIDVMWTAARTCYSAKSPIEMWDNRWDGMTECYTKTAEEFTAKHWNLVKKVLDSGHQSIAEHVYFTFAIEGISRACSHQLVRHRAGIVFSQQSQRYVEIKEDYHYLSDLNFDNYCYTDDVDEMTDEERDIKTEELEKQIKEILNKYFVDVNESNLKGYLDCLLHYLYDTNVLNTKPEDARMILPNATKTNITMSVNFRELIHLCNLRLCTRAQKEIRDLFGLIVKEVKDVDERLASYLVPQCEVHGVCQEKMCCGRKPKFEDVMNTYKSSKTIKEENDMYQTIVSREDMEKLFQNEDNPEVQEKLRKLMEMKSVWE